MTRPHHAIFSAEHEELREAVRRFVATEVRPFVDEWEGAGHFPDSLFRRCGELGFLGLHYPAAWGGSDGDLAAGIVFVEELARGRRGSHRDGDLGPVRHGDAGARASSAPTRNASAGCGPRSPGRRSARLRSPNPTRVRTSPRSVLVLSATATCGASTARRCSSPTARARDFLTLVARTDEPGSGHRGISLFIVDTSLPGVSISRKLDKLGMWSSDTAEISLDDVAVPADELIGGEPNQGFAQLMWQLQYERLAGAAACVGHAAQTLEETIEYARSRTTFGRPLTEHQVIAHKLADAATELEAARALLYSTAWRVMHDEYPVTEISMTKKYCAQVQNRLVDACLQVFGGAGYLAETPVSRAFRDARLQRIGGGTDEIMNEVIAKRILGTTAGTRGKTRPEP